MYYRIFLKSLNKKELYLISNKIYNFLLRMNSKINNVISISVRKKKFCVLRSPHVNKDSQEHFELEYCKQIIDFDLESVKLFDELYYLKLLSTNVIFYIEKRKIKIGTFFQFKIRVFLKKGKN